MFLSLLLILWCLLQFRPHNRMSQSIQLSTQAKLQYIFKGSNMDLLPGEMASLTLECTAYCTQFLTIRGLERVPVSMHLCIICKTKITFLN